jgi:iron complex outermembrane receptor protein
MRPSALVRPIFFAVFVFGFLRAEPDSEGRRQAEATFLGEIAVTERRPDPEEPGLFPFFVVRPSAAGRTRSIADLLKWVPGVTVLETGSRAGVSTVFYRGTPSLHSRVLWNDVPLGFSYSGFTDLSEIPSDGVESISVGARIGEEWLFGAPPGAVISISSRPPSERLSASGSTGSFGLAKWSISAPVSNAFFRLRSESEAGDFSFTNDNGTLYNETDDFRDRRRNNRFRQWSAELDTRGERRSLFVSFAQTVEGVPGLYSLQAERPRLSRSRAMVRTHSGRGSWGWTPFLALEAEHYTDELGEVSFLPADVSNANWRAGVGVRKRGFFTQHSADFWRSRDHRASLSSQQARLHGHFGWSRPWSLRWNHAYLDASAGFQYEWRESDAPEVQPLVGARLFWGPPRLTHFLGFRRVHRFPTFFERFGNSGTVIGNRDLQPETGFQLELGTVRVGNHTQTQVTAYASRMSSLIYYFQNSQRNFVAQNFGRAGFYGLEASHQRRLTAPTRLYLTATFQRAVASDAGYLSGRDLPNRPRLLYSASLASSIGSAELRLNARGRFGGYYDAGNLLPIRSRLIADLSVASPLNRSLLISITVRNLFDDSGLDFLGYPLPGRSLEVSLSSAPRYRNEE